MVEVAQTAFANAIEPDYRAQRAAIETTFPAAHGFLGSLEALASEGLGFHLGTAKNIHLYVDRRFLAYVRVELGTRSTPRLALWAKYNVALKTGTFDDSGCLFGRPLDRLVMQHGGFKDGWALKAKGAEELTFMRTAPTAFFNGLLDLLRELASARPHR